MSFSLETTQAFCWKFESIRKCLCWILNVLGGHLSDKQCLTLWHRTCNSDITRDLDADRRPCSSRVLWQGVHFSLTKDNVNGFAAESSSIILTEHHSWRIRFVCRGQNTSETVLSSLQFAERAEKESCSNAAGKLACLMRWRIQTFVSLGGPEVIPVYYLVMWHVGSNSFGGPARREVDTLRYTRRGEPKKWESLVILIAQNDESFPIWYPFCT